MSNPIVLRWDRRTTAARAAVWRVLSDTDRFNRVAGFGFKFARRATERGVVRTGHVRRFGLDLTWEEAPWTFTAPEGFVVVRVFDSGPAERVETELRLTARADGGTDVRYEVRLYPRYYLATPIVAADARLSTAPAIERALDAALASLEGSSDYDAPPALSNDRRQLVEARCAALGRVGEGLREAILHAPLVEQDRLRPLALAQRWRATDDEAVAGCLAAVRDGLLTMHFELCCPSCHGAQLRLDSLVAKDAVHCPTCELTFDGTFPESVEVVFRPAPTIREFAVATDCVASPARTPHVLTQARMAAGAEWSGSLDLPLGAYRLVAGGAAVIDVIEGGPAEAAVLLDAEGVLPSVLRVGPKARLHVRNRRADAVVLSLREQWRPPGALSAGRLVEHPDAASLIPPGALSGGSAVESGRRGVLVVATEPIDELRRRFQKGPVREHLGNGVLITTWDSAAWALAAAESLAGDPRVRSALAVGPVVELSEVPSGRTVDLALAALGRASAGRTRLATPDEADVREALAALGDQVSTIGGAPGRDAILAFPDAERKRQRAPIDQRKTGGALDAFAGLYRLHALLGEGAFGQVWDAEELAGGRRLAIKLLREELAADTLAAQRFYNEARIVTRLNSPHTVRVYDYGTGGARLYMAMERLDGRELAEVLADGPMGEDRVRRLAVGLLASLADAHAHGIVHRDLKPANVFLLAGDRVKVIDFGIAQQPDDRVDPEVMLGTPLYMAPEQLEGSVDARSDLYAAGLVLYECLTGRLPWEGPPRARVFQRLATPPAPLAGVDPALAAWILRALEREPDARWPSADAMARALPPG